METQHLSGNRKDAGFAEAPGDGEGYHEGKNNEMGVCIPSSVYIVLTCFCDTHIYIL